MIMCYVLIILEKFCKFDYGASENLRHYNTKTPPEYNLSKISVPAFIIHSKNDKLSSKKVIFLKMTYIINDIIFDITEDTLRRHLFE